MNLKHVKGIPIDAADSTDLDDAVHFAFHKDGSYTVTVSVTYIADYVAKGSPEEITARKLKHSYYNVSRDRLEKITETKGMNVSSPDYYDGKHLYMFGTDLCTEKACLVPGTDRPALSMIIECDKNNLIKHWNFEKTILTVGERITPEKFSEEPKYRKWRKKAAKLKQLYLSASAGNENISYADGAHEPGGKKFVETMMQMYNHGMGVYASHHGITIPYRCLLSPDDKHCYDAHVSSFSLLKVPENEIKKGNPILDLGILRNNSGTDNRAFRTLDVLGHLHIGGGKLYAPSSSPLRRYSDFIIHLAVDAHLKGKPSLFTENELRKIAIEENTENYKERIIAAEKEKKETEQRYINAFLNPEHNDMNFIRSADAAGMLEIAIDGYIKNPQFRNTIIKQINNAWHEREVSDNLLLVILHKLPKESGFWKPLKEAALDFIYNNPNRGISLLHDSCVAHKEWNDYRVRGRSHGKRHGHQVCVNIGGKSLSAQKIRLSSESDSAKRINIRSFWQEYMDGNLVPDKESVLVFSTGNEENGRLLNRNTAGIWNNLNTDDILKRMAFRMKWQHHPYYGENCIPGNYIAKQRIRFDDKSELITTVGEGTSSAHALRAAAHSMLNLLDEKKLLPPDFAEMCNEINKHRKKSGSIKMIEAHHLEALPSNLPKPGPV